MRKKLISHVDALFAHAPKNQRVRELHDEILLNSLDRYDEELAAGQSEEAAYQRAIEGIGDINELLEPLFPNKVGMTTRAVLAIALYICAVIPVIIGSAFGDIGSTIGVCLIFVCAAAATYLITTTNLTVQTRRLKQLRGLGIGLYVLCVVPVIALEPIHSELGALIGVCLMFLIIAAATALVIYAGSALGRQRRPLQEAAPRQAPLAAPAPKQKRYGLGWKIFVPCYWISVVFACFRLGTFLISWKYVWILFPIASGVYDVILGCYLWWQGKPGLKSALTGLLWIFISVCYFILTWKTQKWAVTWLMFPIGAALSAVLSGIFDLCEKRRANQ